MRSSLRVVLTMTDLKKTSAIVEHLLRTNKQTRNSDSYLYLKVLEYLDEQRDDSVSRLPVSTFLRYLDDFNVPGFETVRRARQKMQVKFPELAACEKVQEGRFVNEQRYRAFALSKGGGANG